MQISQRSKEIIDACRFCWMCRHICPIGNATGQERNTSRARALSLSLVKRGAAELKGDIVDNLYECALCGGCTHDCATGYDPVQFTKEARLAAALDGNMPDYVEKLLDNIDKTGNIYGITEIADVLKNAIKDLPKRADILFFIGKDGAYKTPEKAAAAVELLKKSGVNFTVDKHEPNSGYDIDFLIGASDETRKIMSDTANRLNESGAKTIVCYDGYDAKIFLREYKEYGIVLNADIVTFPAFVSELISGGKLHVKKSDRVYTFQDPPAIARDLEDADSARKILDACGTVREMLLCKDATMLAGNLLMNEYIPDVMQLVAKNRLENAKNVNAEVIVTASPSEYYMLNSVNDSSADVITIEEAVEECL